MSFSSEGCKVNEIKTVFLRHTKFKPKRLKFCSKYFQKYQ